MYVSMRCITCLQTCLGRAMNRPIQEHACQSYGNVWQRSQGCRKHIKRGEKHAHGMDELHRYRSISLLVVVMLGCFVALPDISSSVISQDNSSEHISMHREETTASEQRVHSSDTRETAERARVMYMCVGTNGSIGRAACVSIPSSSISTA